jgi:hypothetical protein
MGVTTVDLYRNGNATGPRLEHVRIFIADPDVDFVIDSTGEFWVLTGNGKGVSTWAALDPGWSRPWRLPRGAIYPDSLYVWQDGTPGHWAWAPATAMPLADYIAALATVSPSFVRA